MIISRLDLKAFGRFTDVSIDLSAGQRLPQPGGSEKRPRRFHVIYGLNESGKSTSLRAITSLLFGMPHITEDNYVHANAQMRVGGLLVDETGRTLECVRRRGRKATLRDADDHEPIDESQLESMLGGIDRETFLTRFGLSHDELVAGGAAILSGEGDLGQILFAAGAGVGKLREIQSQLDESGGRLFNPRGSKAAVNAAVRQLEEQRKELRQAQIAPAEFSELRGRIEQKRADADAFSQQVQQCAVTLARLRNYQQAAPLLPAWRSNIQSLKTLKATPILDEAFTERRRQAISDREVAASRQAELETRITELTARLEALPTDTVVMNHESEIQAVFQEVAARDKADRDRLGLIRNQRNTDRKIIDLLRELSVEISDEDEDQKSESIEKSIEQLRLSDSLRNRIRELASSYERLIGSRNDASDAVETTKRRLADATEELESMVVGGDPAVLTGAIEAVGDPQAMREGITVQQESCDLLRHRCDELLRRLDGFHGSLEDASNLRRPSETMIAQHARELQSAQQNLQAREDQLKQRQNQRDEINGQIRDEQTSVPLPTMEELSDARQQRDRATDRVAELIRRNDSQPAQTPRTSTQDPTGGDDEIGDAIEQLRQCIRLTDQLADTMRTHHQQVHQRSEMASRAAAMESQIERAKSAIAAARESLDDANQKWLALWQSCGVQAAPPERMQRWLADHEQLCESLRRLSEEEKRLEQTKSRVDRAAMRLRTVLEGSRSKKPIGVTTSVQGGLFDEPSEDDLIALYDDAVALRSSWTRTRQHYDAVLRRRDELAEELPQAETRFEAAQKNVEAWREDWRRTTDSFVKSDRASTREVLQMLDQIGELCSKKRERDILVSRIRSIGEDEMAYAARVSRLAAATAELPASDNAGSNEIGADGTRGEDRPPTAVAQSLYQRLQAERTAARSRDSLREQIEATRQRLAEVAAARSACQAVLKQLCQEAGCKEADELPEIERAARERISVQTNLRDLENQLSILAGDQPLSEFIEAAAEQKSAVLEVEIEQRENELRLLREQMTVIQQEIGALQHEISLMDGSSRASELLQGIQMTAGQICRDAEEYARIRIASLILRRAIDHYRKANQSPVLSRANKLFAQLTCGEYSQLRPDYDAKGKSTLLAIRADGTTAVPANSMSSGTADALYLALRLASLQHHAARGPSIPLIIDDCLVQLDNDRVVATLKVFSELSEQTQVILFTHHAHIVALARQHLESKDFHLHQLGV